MPAKLSQVKTAPTEPSSFLALTCDLTHQMSREPAAGAMTRSCAEMSQLPCERGKVRPVTVIEPSEPITEVNGVFVI